MKVGIPRMRKIPGIPSALKLIGQLTSLRTRAELGRGTSQKSPVCLVLRDGLGFASWDRPESAMGVTQDVGVSCLWARGGGGALCHPTQRIHTLPVGKHSKISLFSIVLEIGSLNTSAIDT